MLHLLHAIITCHLNPFPETLLLLFYIKNPSQYTSLFSLLPLLLFFFVSNHFSYLLFHCVHSMASFSSSQKRKERSPTPFEGKSSSTRLAQGEVKKSQIAQPSLYDTPSTPLAYSFLRSFIVMLLPFLMHGCFLVNLGSPVLPKSQIQGRF